MDAKTHRDIESKLQADVTDLESADNLDAPFYEQEAFESIWDGLRWCHVRKRLPLCFKKTLHNRYMLANLIYLGYTIGLLIIDFNPSFYGASAVVDETSLPSTTTTAEPIPLLDQPVENNAHVNRLYIGLAVVNLITAFLYWWAWKDRSSFDVVLIPEYLNHIQAVLYLWSAVWYQRQETLGGHYTMAVHKIEVSASASELLAAIGWMISWHLTYTRTLGRGYTLDDPDTVAYLATTTNTLMYLVYNTTLLVHPEQYGTNYLYTTADVLGFVGACFYVFANLRDDNWFWFLPLAGQYGVAPGRVRVEPKVLPQSGKNAILISDLCRRRVHATKDHVVTVSYH